MGGEGFEPPKASANGFTVRPGSPTPASALKLKKEQQIYLYLQKKANAGITINAQLVMELFMHFLMLPEFSVQTPVLNCFTDMLGKD